MRRILKFLLVREFRRHMYTRHNIEDCVFCHMDPSRQLNFVSEISK